MGDAGAALSQPPAARTPSDAHAGVGCTAGDCAAKLAEQQAKCDAEKAQKAAKCLDRYSFMKVLRSSCTCQPRAGEPCPHLPFSSCTCVMRACGACLRAGVREGLRLGAAGVLEQRDAGAGAVRSRRLERVPRRRVPRPVGLPRRSGPRTVSSITTTTALSCCAGSVRLLVMSCGCPWSQEPVHPGGRGDPQVQ